MRTWVISDGQRCQLLLLVYRRESTITNLGAAETKLLYTLHWVILDAAEECVDADHEHSSHAREPGDSVAYLFSVTTIQVVAQLILLFISSLIFFIDSSLEQPCATCIPKPFS